MLDALIVTPGSSADLRGRDPRDMLGLSGKDEGKARLDSLTDELSSFQERLYAQGKRSVLLVLQESTRKAATSRRSIRRHRMSLPTTSSGASRPSVRRAA